MFRDLPSGFVISGPPIAPTKANGEGGTRDDGSILAKLVEHGKTCRFDRYRLAKPHALGFFAVHAGARNGPPGMEPSCSYRALQGGAQGRVANDPSHAVRPLDLAARLCDRRLLVLYHQRDRCGRPKACWRDCERAHLNPVVSASA